jgi:hypothetical protein
VLGETNARTGCSSITGCTEAIDEFAFGVVVQHGCCASPIWQSPTIFLQQSISAGVMCRSGRQASAGESVQKTSKLTTVMERILATL